jgi:hypothetical protein
MASQPEPPAPDTIDPVAPPETPPQQSPSEEPFRQPDEFNSPSPDIVQPSQQPMETRRRPTELAAGPAHA